MSRFNPLTSALALRPLNVIFIAILLSGCQWNSGNSSDDIELSGTLDAREVPLAFQVGGRLQTLHADEGDSVSSDQLLAKLDPADYQLAQQRAQADVDAASAVLAAMEAGTRVQEIRIAEAALTQAGSELQYAESEVKRITALLPQKLASQEQLDQSQLRYNVAWSVQEQAQHKLALLREGPRKEDIDRARADQAARQTALATSQRQLDYTRLSSPVSGVISLRLAEAGQVLSPGQPVLQITELSKPWLRAYLREEDLPRVKLGQAALLRVDGLPNQRFKGRVSFISPKAEFTPKTVETRELRVDLVYLIKIEVDNPDGLLKVGMPADVTLTTEQ